MKYFVIDNAHLNSVEQQFNASAANTEAAQIIIEFAREHPEIYRHFGKRVKKLLRKEYAPRNVPEELRIQQGLKAKHRPIYEQVMHDQPIIAPLPEARIVIHRLRQHATPPARIPTPISVRSVTPDRPTTSRVRTPVRASLPAPSTSRAHPRIKNVPKSKKSLKRKKREEIETVFIPSSPSLPPSPRIPIRRVGGFGDGRLNVN